MSPSPSALQLIGLRLIIVTLSGSLFEFYTNPSSQAKGTNSISFLTCVRNEVELVPLACEDDTNLAICNVVVGLNIHDGSVTYSS